MMLHFLGVPGRNLIASPEPARWKWMPTGAGNHSDRPNVSVASGLLYNGEPVVRWRGAGSMQIAALSLESSPVIAGQAVYATVRAQVGSSVWLRLALDAGDGTLVRATLCLRHTRSCVRRRPVVRAGSIRFSIHTGVVGCVHCRRSGTARVQATAAGTCTASTGSRRAQARYDWASR